MLEHLKEELYALHLELLVRAMKIMDAGLEGGTSFMEDYTYHFGSNGIKVLGSHMLEVCETIASPAEKPRLEGCLRVAPRTAPQACRAGCYRCGLPLCRPFATLE